MGYRRWIVSYVIRINKYRYVVAKVGSQILHAKRVEQEVKRALEDDETGDQASDSDVDVTSSHWQWKFVFFCSF